MHRNLAPLLAVAWILLGAAPAAADVSGPEIVAFLNAQRAAHGVPAGIVENPTLSDGCAKHNAYGALNGVLTHGEDAALPGFTTEGDQAGKTSVLYAGGGPWSASRNPFETAPIHLHQLLAPRLDQMGASENQDYGCATTLASRNRPAPLGDVTYTYPGNGATAWPTAQVAAEGPDTPGQRVGIPAGTQTGPYLYVMFDGADVMPWDTATATGATLTGPDGPVDVAFVDNHTSGLEGYLPTGMEVIPRAPLRANATYTASVAANVTVNGGGGARAFTYTWAFTTGGLENAVRITQTSASGREIRVWVSSHAPGATVTATGPGSPITRAAGADGSAVLGLDADGPWLLCARSGGAATGYIAAEDCIAMTVSQPAPAPPPPSTSTKPGARPFTVAVSARVGHGRAIKLAITATARSSLRIRVTARGRTLKRYPARTLKGDGTRRTFTVQVRSPYNRRGRSVRLTLTVVAQGKTYTVHHTVRFR